jgi:hypothetical protein
MKKREFVKNFIDVCKRALDGSLPEDAEEIEFLELTRARLSLGLGHIMKRKKEVDGVLDRYED